MLIAVIVCGTQVASMATATSGSMANTIVCERGESAGQCSEPTGLAVDEPGGRLYVADGANRRADIFDADGPFQSAFGWGVSDGTTAESQSCIAICFAGLAGAGAGQFSRPRYIAVDSSSHDVYVFDNLRVQRFSATGEFLGAWGGGVVTGGAVGVGDLSIASSTITNVKTTQKAFAIGQVITGTGIPASTRITALGSGTITLSQGATSSGTGVSLSVAEGSGNLPLNEVQVLTIEQPTYNPGSGQFGDKEFHLEFTTPPPSPSSAVTAGIPSDACPDEVQAALASLINIGAGNVKVTSSGSCGEVGKTAGPYMIEFNGPRFADTDVTKLASPGTGPTREIATYENGASSPEICTVANAAACRSGLAPGENGFKGSKEGQFINTNGKTDAPLVVTPDGAILVSDEERVQRFEPSGVSEGQCQLTPNGLGRTRGVAAGGGGEFYVSSGSTVRRYDASCKLLATLNFSGSVEALALDGIGNLFVGDALSFQNERGDAGVVYEYDSDGTPLRAIYGGSEELAAPAGLAVHTGATGEIYVAESGSSGRVLHVGFPEPGPVVHPYPGATEADPVGNVKVTLKSRVNPEGKESKFHFDYVDDSTFQKSGFAEAKTSAEDDVSVDGEKEFPEFDLRPVSAVVGCVDPAVELAEEKCLIPETKYHFRAVAKNLDGKNIGPEAEFTTRPALEIIDTWSTDAGTDVARLHASVNPLGIPATGHFEYVDDATFQASGFEEAKETGDIDFGSGEAPVAKSAQLLLEPNTTYHFRIVVSNPLVKTAFLGPERAFTTFQPTLPAKFNCVNARFRVGVATSLPDCRAYEMVSPLDKDNGEVFVGPGIFGANSPPARLDQAASKGEKITFSAAQAFSSADSAPYSSQYLAERDPEEGWQTRAINAKREGPSFYSNLGKEIPYQAFSDDLCSGWFWQDTDLPLVEGAPAGVPNLYRRKLCGEEGFELLTTVVPSEPAPGFGVETDGIDSRYFLMAAGFSADGTSSVFRAGAKLTSEAANKDIYQLYLMKGGELHLVSVLPTGKAAATHSSLGTSGDSTNFRTGSVQHAVSEDASRVFFSAMIKDSEPVHKDNGAVGAGESRLYVRLNPAEPQSEVKSKKCTEPEAAKACTIGISEAVSADAAARFWTADPQGKVAIFSIGEDLYEFDVEKAAEVGKGEVSMVTLIAHRVKGLLGASEDASKIYLVSQEDHDGAGPAEEGRPNLYLYERGGEFRFIRSLATADLEPPSPASSAPNGRVARVSMDGENMTFMSRASLTTYDNIDAQSGEPDAEVFHYSAEDEELVCVSCNPSGGRPTGGRNLGGKGGPSETQPFYVAARIPGWETQTHPSRVLSDDGSRLFFESFEGLVPRDTNGKQDVYEWERSESKAQCEEAGAELYAASSGGCLSLISSGTSAGDAEFLDASADGRDVFFTTASSLLPQDYGLVDIYDAREGGGFPSPPTPKQPCEGEACQSPPAPPDAPSPSSSTFEGQGNLSTPPNKRCPKGKRKVRKAGKTRCVKKPKKAKHHKRSHGEKGAGR